MSSQPVTAPAHASPSLPPVLRPAGVSSPNGSPSHASSHPPAPPRRRKGLLLATAVFALLSGAGGGVAYLVKTGVLFKPAPRADLLLHTVRRQPLQLTVVERGALESADNREVVCRVRAGTKTQALTIKWVIDDGTQVKKDQLLVDIDDSALQDSLKAERILLDQARAASIAADENYKIQVSQNLSDIETAKIVIQLAEMDLEKYLKGDYLQAKKDVDNRILLAKADLGLQKDRLAWTERMVRMKYMSPTQEQSELSRYKSLEVALDKVLEEERVLDDFTKKRTITDLSSKVEEAKRALDRVLKQTKAKEVQAESDRLAKKSVLDQEQDKYDDIEEQIHRCQIHSPQDGMVVYYVSDQSRYGSGSSQSIIAQGEPVKEGQKLMRIPDLRHMLVNTKVHEAMVSRVHGELWQTTGFTEALRAALLINNDAPSRLFGQQALLEMKDRFRDQEMKKVVDGQKATVRVDAFPERTLPGHIKSVATVAAQQDWMSADVKVYQTMISIDESLEGLKPGMSAEVTMYVENLNENVLTVPLQAIVGGAEMGRKRRVFVDTPEGPQEREVVIGLSNEKLAEVKSGLEEGEQVVLNPRVLLGDRAKTREVIPGEKPGPGAPGGEGKGKDGKAKGGPPDAGGPGGMPARPAK